MQNEKRVKKKEKPLKVLQKYMLLIAWSEQSFLHIYHNLPTSDFIDEVMILQWYFLFIHEFQVSFFEHFRFCRLLKFSL